ncbi:MAG: N-acetylmuramoyl-L-alanine amidase [Candidatus Tokpelaia sp. JSC189]|nr:MAG: N-acetylmuramoyl-L-alanine amidase [Candidatus Tokpelaia sp. JSC189]
MLFFRFRSFFLAVFLSILLVLSYFSHPIHAESQISRLVSLHTSGDIKRVRITAVFNGRSNYDIMLLARPARLVINLPETEFLIQKDDIKVAGFLKNVRYGMINYERSRIIFEASSSFHLENVVTESLENEIWRLVIDLVISSDQEFERLIKAQRMQKIPEDKSKSSIQGEQTRNWLFTVVIDAGHGAFDNGATGVSGVLEKEVTLAFAKTLKDFLQKEPGINAYLTRENDIFLRLNERMNIARSYGADLFISIHADHIDLSDIRGATVYTISDRASDTLAKSLADHENKADILDGFPLDEPSEIANILIDLTRKEVQAFSIDFAEKVISSLQEDQISLIRNPHRYAGFQVLRAPDIPSVLIELGYLSNSEDEKLISDPLWREKMAKLIARSVRNYVNSHRRQIAKP